MKRQFRKSEANRVLVQWARNMRQGYVNLDAMAMNFDDFVGGGRSVFTDDYSLEEKLCLSEMTAIRVEEPELYKVAELEYIKQAMWLAECRERRGWRENESRVFHPTHNPNRDTFLRFVSADYSISKTQFYNRLNRLQRRIYERVV